MKKYARIANGKVAELFSTDGDISEMFHPSIVWVEIATLTPAVFEGWDGVKSAGGGWAFTAPVPPAKSQLVAQAINETRIQRQPILLILDGMQASALTKGDAATATTLETAKQALKDITKTDLTGCVTADDIKVAILNRYKAIAAGLPAGILSAFSGSIS